MKKLFSLFVVAFISLSMMAATETTVYYCIPSATLGSNTLKLNVKLQSDADTWANNVMTETGKTYNGNPIYSATYTDMYDGAARMQFQIYNGSQWISQEEPITSWTSVADYNGKMKVYGAAGWIEYAEDASSVQSAYCQTEVGYLASETADPNSYVLLSIGATVDGKTIVRIDQDEAKNSQMFDFLQVSGQASTGEDVAAGGSKAMAVEFNTPAADADGNITLEILWSTVGWAGRWMVQNLTVPAAAVCASAVVPQEVHYYLKHNWKGAGAWNWKQLLDNEDGTYSITDYYGGTGCNWNTASADDGSSWVASPTLVNDPATGDKALFTLNPSTGVITITKLDIPASPYCRTEYNQTPDENSYVLLTIGATEDGTTIVRIDQDRAHNQQLFDVLNIVGVTSVGADGEDGEPALGVEFTTPTPDASGNISLTIQWSTANWNGRWQATVSVPYDAYCASATVPAPLGDFYLKHNWNAEGWSWKKLTRVAGTTTYTIEAAYGATGCNWNSIDSNDGAIWVETPTLIGSPQVGDNCKFTLDPVDGTIAITNLDVHSEYCETEVGHLFLETPDANSYVLLSIGATAEGKTIVRIDQDSEKNSQKFDYLQVSGHASTGEDVTSGGYKAMAVEFDTPTPDADGNITLEILWSNVDNGGRWMVQGVTVNAAGKCDAAVVPVAITSYTVVGAGCVNGDTDWATENTDNDMTLQADGTYQLYIRSIYLEKGFFNYKMVANHVYGIYEIPASGNQQFETWSAGYYQLTYTFDPEAETLTVDVVFSGQWPTAIENNDATSSQKFIHEGNLYILRDGKVYNVLGTRM